MKKVLLKTGVGFGLWSLPFALFAQQLGGFGQASNLIDGIIAFINNTLVPFIFALAFLVFIWGVFQYFIFSKGDETGQEKGKNLMLWGIIGFFVMVAIWGIVNLLVTGVGLDTNAINSGDFPKAPGIR